MTIAIDTIQVGPFGAVSFDQGASAWAVVLPGAGYSGQAPLLWYARFAALVAGRNALVVTESFDPSRHDPLPWAEELAVAALNHVGGDDPAPVLIAKSLTSLAAGLVAKQSLPAVWLTPLIADGSSPLTSSVLEGLQAATRPRLLLGGTADEAWDGAVAASLPMSTVVELPGADHSLEVKSDLEASLSNLQIAARAMARFMNDLRRANFDR